MSKEQINETLTKLVNKMNKVIKEAVETVGDAVEESPGVAKQSWEDLAARGQRIASKWSDGNENQERGGTLEAIRSNIESQLESMPKRARDRTFKTLSHLAGVVDNLSSLGPFLEAAPDHGATLSGHGLRPIYGPMDIRRAAGTSAQVESTIGARRRIARQWRREGH
ncbi:hypothetical protein [Stomatohabitans albus]|uniref:hypothetical protein n=1 Tax=Stomatohabitans albus TaxID=3110766 RepID=UPI00300C24F8